MPNSSLSLLPVALEIGREYPPPGEDAVVQQLREWQLKMQSVRGPGLRGEHPKQHGGVWARFSIEKDIPSGFRVGIFKEPRIYTAIVRYSNGRAFDDQLPDVRGMAVKVFVPKVFVPREGNGPDVFQQDFILADHPVFFARNVQHLLDFMVATAAGTPVSQLEKTAFPKLAGFTSLARSSPLRLTYWSQTPYRLGEGAVKYVAYPSQEEEGPAIELSQSPDALREAMMEQLSFRKMGAHFDFCVTPQCDAAAMPVEDPTVEWMSPPCKLATVSIYPQKFDSPEQMSFVENLTWSPWHSLPEHSPLGGINRARRDVYPDSQELRHKTTGAKPYVPSGRESF
jgi:hypothetical protein